MSSSNATEQIPWTPWTAPDLESQRSRHGTTPMLGLLVWAIMGLAMFLVILRIYYHVFRGRRHLWSDDYFLIAALVCLIGNGIAIEQWIPYKFEPNLTTPQIPALVLIGSLMGLFNSLALALSKTSLAITFIRLTTGWWKSSLGLSIFAIDCLFAVQAWSFWVPDCGIKHEPYRIQTAGGACISYESIKSFRFAVQTLSCVLDAYFTILPWKIVRPLALKRFEKIGLGIAMSFGCASLMSGIIRELILFHLSNEPSEYQPLYSVGGFLFNYFEPSFTIIAACIPVCRKLFVDVVRWKKNNPFFLRVIYRRKRRVEPTELPLSELREVSASANKNIVVQSTVTIVSPSTPPTAKLSSTGCCRNRHDAA